MLEADLTKATDMASPMGMMSRVLGSPAIRLSAMAVSMVAIFVSDTLTDLEIATAVFYSAVILLAVGRFRSRYVVGLAAVCILLTLTSFLLTKSGSREAGIINLAISLSTIAITTYLALKVVRAEGIAHEARAQMIRVARVTSLGALTSSIAHEVNQPLAAIATSSDAALRWLNSAPPNLDRSRAAIERIAGDASRASTIIARIRDHARGAPPVFQLVRIDEVIEDAVALSHSVLERQDISLNLALAAHLPSVLGDRVQLQQVVCNLILNAIEAMTNVEPHTRTLSLAAVSDASGDIEVSASDTGIGIQEEHLSRLFDAFWTTKGSGTGIGLTISRTIVEAHGGAIWVDRMKPNGARFHVRLPAYGATAE